MRINVNNKEMFEAQEVAFDGCHKFYLIEDENAHKEMTDTYGYEESDFYGLEELPSLWEISCPFRFINMSTSLESVIPQCVEDASIVVADEVLITYEL